MMQVIYRGAPSWGWRLYAWLRGEATPSWWQRPALAPLGLAAQVYRLGVETRLAWYTYGLRSPRRLPCRVVSIGNLTLGGTGKTPLTLWTARWFRARGLRVAVLSRGYGARGAAACQVVSAGAGPRVEWRTAGDEPYMLARSLPGVPVLTGPNRYRTGRYACEHFGAQVVILDDGFQHHALHRDLDVVLVDASAPFGSGALVPRGILREPLRALRRADAIVLTRIEMAPTTLTQLEHRLHRIADAPQYPLTTVARALCQDGHVVPDGLAGLRRHRVLAFAGIGNPQAFATTLTRLGARVEVLVVFPDHHPYTAADWRFLRTLAQQHRATCLVTTEKDTVRLPPHRQTFLPVYAVQIDVRFGAESLASQLQELVAGVDPAEDRRPVERPLPCDVDGRSG